MKKFILAVIAVFVAWSILDMVIHGVILEPLYRQSAQLWRPEGEMMMTLMYVVIILSSIFFVWIYYALINKSMKNALLYGLFYGLATGIGMGYGTYSFMPIPYLLALGWFLATVVQAVVAGALVGWIIKEEEKKE